ncbi:hypothetical protein [Microbacterium sp.]|uniref:hypothetical protein n=1 Tax=Microbacterium sp. TaxID=51671 RepID=UPI0027372550|nr:hypothetical protein [Microbacterium sp.]MDP3951155.1 hypothetical protein [Microbacterium sp.]
MAIPASRDEASHRGQIKSRERVRSLAEVYTHKREVDAMLDLVADMFPSEDRPGETDRKFLEPACGSGNFLEEILTRKLEYVTTARYGSGAQFEFRTLRALASIYAIDINQENVDESRDRLRAVVSSHIDMEMNTRAPSSGFVDAVEVILDTNIIRADSLADSGHLTFVDYRASRGHTFTREWSPMEPSDDLFAAFDTRADATPVHYADLASVPEPTGVSQ